MIYEKEITTMKKRLIALSLVLAMLQPQLHVEEANLTAQQLTQAQQATAQTHLLILLMLPQRGE